MSTDQVAEIAPLVREILASDASELDAQLCATIEVVGHPEAWAQLIPGNLNFAYPLSVEPEEALSDIMASLPDCTVVSWEAGMYATLAFERADPRVVSIAIDALLSRLFALKDYSIDGSIQELSP